jgi:hypothetical protein
MKRSTLVLVTVALIVSLSAACTPTAPPPIPNYTCHAGNSWDIGTTPIAGFAFGVKDNALAFSSNNGTCTGPNPLKITLVQSLESDPIAAQAAATALCVSLGGFTNAVLLQGYPDLTPGVYECD